MLTPSWTAGPSMLDPKGTWNTEPLTCLQIWSSSSHLSLHSSKLLVNHCKHGLTLLPTWQTTALVKSNSAYSMLVSFEDKHDCRKTPATMTGLSSNSGPWTPVAWQSHCMSLFQSLLNGHITASLSSNLQYSTLPSALVSKFIEKN